MRYTPQKVARELICTALGESYYGNALYVAMDFSCVNETDKRCLHRYMYGATLKTDHVLLQDIAHKIMKEPLC